MKKLYLLLIICLMHTGCKPDNIDKYSSREAPTLVALAVKPDNPSISPNTAIQLSAVGTFSNSMKGDSTESVVWTSSDPSVATVNTRGEVQALSAGPASTLITATSGSVAGSATVTISPLASLSITPADTAMAPGTTQQLTAEGVLQNNATQDLSFFAQWSSSDAAVASVSGTGLVTAGVASTGSSLITAEFSGISGTTLLTSSPIISVTLTPAAAQVIQGQTRQFRAVGMLLNGVQQDITDFAAWSLQPSAAGVISSKGLALSTASGSALITAALGSASGSAVLTATSPRSIVSITVSPSAPSLVPGGTRQFTARAEFSDGTVQDVTAQAVWSSSNTFVANISNLPGSKGMLTALSGGTTGITASFSGIRSAETVITVTSATALTASLIITPSAPFVRIGNTLQLKAALLFSDGTVQDLPAVVWSSSNTNIAFVSQGFATGLSAGTTTVTAVNGNLSGSAVLTVTAF